MASLPHALLAAGWLALAGFLLRRRSRRLKRKKSAPRANWAALGDERLRAGDIAGSVQAFDRVIALDSSTAPYLWQRGIALFYLGRFDDCAKQFEIHRSVNPADVENPVWHFLCRAAASSVEQAKKDLLPVGSDPRTPMAEIYELFAGRGGVTEVRDAAKANGTQHAQFYAELYLALFYEVSGENQAALEALEKANRLRLDGYMPDVARIHQRHLEDLASGSPRP